MLDYIDPKIANLNKSLISVEALCENNQTQNQTLLKKLISSMKERDKKVENFLKELEKS